MDKQELHNLELSYFPIEGKYMALLKLDLTSPREPAAVRSYTLNPEVSSGHSDIIQIYFSDRDVINKEWIAD